MAIAQINSWGHATESCYRNSKKAESKNKIAQSPRKQLPKSYFTQSLATISPNPLENHSSIIFVARTMLSEWRYNASLHASVCSVE